MAKFHWDRLDAGSLVIDAGLGQENIGLLLGRYELANEYCCVVWQINVVGIGISWGGRRTGRAIGVIALISFFKELLVEIPVAESGLLNNSEVFLVTRFKEYNAILKGLEGGENLRLV